MQYEIRRAVVPQANLDLAPSHSAGEVIPRERLVRCLLGGGAGREVERRLDTGKGVPCFVFGEDSRDQALAARVEHLPHAVDLDDVDPDAQNHSRSSPPERRRHRDGAAATGEETSASDSAGQLLSATRKTIRNWASQGGHFAIGSDEPSARSRSDCNASRSGSMISNNSASKARRAGARAAYRSLANARSVASICAAMRRPSNAPTTWARVSAFAATRRASRSGAK